MKMFSCSFFALACIALAGMFVANPAYADQLIYISLPQPCRLLDTRASVGGARLTAAHGPYIFGTSFSDISSSTQHGNSSGCNIADGIVAVSVNMNLLNTSASGNIATWNVDNGTTAPNIGTAVYNPSVASAAMGEVQYNTGYSTIPVSSSTDSSTRGKFYLQVANGQIDMTINVVGYWLPISLGEIRNYSSTALGYDTTSNGWYSTAMGYGTTATGSYSTAMGHGTTATGFYSTAMGDSTTASGYYSTATGANTTASGNYSTAMGTNTTADGWYSTAMGRFAHTGGHSGSFVYGDSSPTSQYGGARATADNQFFVVATGGVQFWTSAAGGVATASGSGQWTQASDRNLKDAIQPVDPRDVLKKVVALPVNTWHYKAQDPQYRHMGPMAQDFYAAFRLGETDKGIGSIDADGVALAAIQGLNASLEEKIAQKSLEISALRAEKDREIAGLRMELAERIQGKDAEIAALRAEVASNLGELKAQLAPLRRSTPGDVTVAQHP